MPGDASSARRDSHLRLAELTAVPGARVLDLGCGDGATLRELSGRVGTGGWLLGIDRNPPAPWPSPLRHAVWCSKVAADPGRPGQAAADRDRLGGSGAVPQHP